MEAVGYVERKCHSDDYDSRNRIVMPAVDFVSRFRGLGELSMFFGLIP